MATSGPATNAQASAHVRRNNTVGATFAVATTAVVLGLSLMSGGAAALTAGFFFKALGLSALTGLIVGAFAQAVVNGELPSARRAHIIRRHHIPAPVGHGVKIHKRAHFAAHPAPTHSTTHFHTGATHTARTFTPGHTAHTTMHTSRPTASSSSSTSAVHRPTLHKSNH